MPNKKSASRRVKVENRILNCLPSKGTINDWAFAHAAGAGLVAAAPVIPPKKDLRESWWKIGDQGQTGSCVGWATADSVLRWHFVKANRLDKKDLLSMRFIWMAAKETDEITSAPTTFIEPDGTTLKAALDVARNYGVVLDKVLPFKSGKLYADKEEVFYATAAQRKIASYFNLGRNLDDWRTWLATNGPILTRLDVDATWYAATNNHGNLDTYQPPAAPAGHCVALVGYTPDRFIVRNSWNTTWGDSGFAYASIQYATAAFTEAYGVSL
jgi:hypothetical protein